MTLNNHDMSQFDLYTRANLTNFTLNPDRQRDRENGKQPHLSEMLCNGR